MGAYSRGGYTWGGLYVGGLYVGGVIRGGGLYVGGGAYRINVDIKKNLLKDLVYFSRNSFMSI